MFRRWILGVALFCVPFAPVAVRAGEKELPPTVTIQVRSLDTVIENVKLLVALAGREEIAKQVEGLIKTKIGDKGLEGIDPSRPFGAYSRMGKDLADISGVVLVPIADEAAFLGLLENLNQKAVKNDDIYRVKVADRVEVFFRFANKYAYVTALNPGALEKKKLIAPEKLFAAHAKSAISMVLRVDQIPEAIRFIAKAQIEQGLQEAQEKPIPGETPAQKKIRIQLLKEIVEKIGTVLNDGQELGVDIDVNKTTKEMSATLSLSALAKSDLAKDIADLGKVKTLFGNLMGKEAVMQGNVTFKLPENFRKLVASAFDDVQGQALTQINDPTQRKQAEELLKAIAPTVKAGEVDFGFSLQGPKNNLSTAALGVKIKNGNDLSKILRQLVGDIYKNLPAEEKAKIELDAETVAGIKVHRLNFSKNYPPDIKRDFGEGPVYVAIRDDAFFVTFGPESMKLMKAALGPSLDSKTAALNAQLSLARVVPMLPEKGEREKAKGVFAPGEEGIIRLSVSGGSQLTIRLSTQLSVVRFFGVMAEKK